MSSRILGAGDTPARREKASLVGPTWRTFLSAHADPPHALCPHGVALTEGVERVSKVLLRSILSEHLGTLQYASQVSRIKIAGEKVGLKNL